MDFIINEILPFAKNHPLLSIGWLALLVVIIVVSVKITFSKVRVISNAMAIHLINKENAIIVDIRSADSFKKGHITESINILPTDIKNGSIKAIEKYKESTVIILDENGMSSVGIGENLIKQDFEHVFALKDGVSGWNGENLPLIKK